MTGKLTEVRVIVKENREWKNRFLKARIGFYIFFTIMIFVTSIILGNFNVFF